MTQARSEKTRTGLSRYAEDATFRAAWDAKTMRGFLNEPGPAVKSEPANEIRMSALDSERAHKIADLTAQKTHLEHVVERIEIRDLDAKLRDPNLDPSTLPRPTAFRDNAEMLRFIGTPAYRGNPAFRAYVEQRIELSESPAEISANNGGSTTASASG